MKLSILICSIPQRKETFLKRLLAQLEKQKTDDVEVIVDADPKPTVGAKRNRLIKQSAGEYIAFVDDDDVISDDYVAEILKAIETNPDFIVFDAVRYHNDKIDRPVKYDIQYRWDYTDATYHYRLPNHLMVWKRKLAEKVPFANISFGEDAKWAKMMKHLNKHKVQHRIDKTLYYYYFNTNTTSTQ